MEIQKVQCPLCLKYVRLRQDGKMTKHTRTNRLRKYGELCRGSEVAKADALQGKTASTDTRPEDIF